MDICFYILYNLISRIYKENMFRLDLKKVFFIVTIFTIIMIKSFINGTTCFNPIKYPKLYGKSSDNTEWNSIDMDPSGNVLVGGTTDSSSIASSTSPPNTIIAYY
jgi:hypothetical protein